MKKKKKILIVDDHPLIIEGYRNILLEMEDEDFDLQIDDANDCREAYRMIKKSIGEKVYDVILLDVNLPPYEEMGLLSGEDLGIKIKEISPSSSLIILTMLEENYRLYNIFKNVNPQALLIKSDVDSSELKRTFRLITAGEVCYSQSITSLLRKQFATELHLDQTDRSILFYLSQGIKTKDLTKKIPVSLTTIEKRKRKIKDAFGMEDGGDLVLVEKAKEMGFL